MFKNKIYSLLPFLIFIFSFLGAGIYFNDFYKLPSPIAVLIGIAVAFVLFKLPLAEKVNQFISGCGDSKIITMCVIYLLAGSFAAVTKAIGGVDMMVQLGLAYIPAQYLPLGIFVIACTLSFSIGTSVGSIVALGTIVVGLSDQSGISLALLCGSLLGGSMFGDNLSLISDTTIAATQTIGCEMKDKFKSNFLLAFPAAVLCCIILYFISQDLTINGDYTAFGSRTINWILLLPYVLVIVLAISGAHVFIVLALSVIAAGIIGIAQDKFNAIGLANEVYQGFQSMTEIFLLSMFTGGLAYMVERQGGIQYILDQMKKIIHSAKSAQLGIGLLVGAINLAVANNTVSILISGNLAREIAEEHHIDKPRAASILDIFSCIVQGLIPYGAQVLILLSFTNGKLNYIHLLQHVYYLYILLVLVCLSIVFKKKRIHKADLAV